LVEGCEVLSSAEKKVKRDIEARSSNRCWRKSGKLARVIETDGVDGGESFRKRDCGFEGKWKGGLEGVSLVLRDAPFPQRDASAMWICGVGRWIRWEWVRGVRGSVGEDLHAGRVVHGLHRGGASVSVKCGV
jgi:hypothetical protein